MQKVKIVLVLDPGHGDTPGAIGYDPGTSFGQKVEAVSALECSLTMKALLTDAVQAHPEIDLDIHLTRDGTGGAKGSLPRRLARAAQLGADLFVSVHFDMKFTPSGHRMGAYYAPGAVSEAAARRIMAAVDAVTPHRVWCKSSFERKDAEGRGGLYIDAFPDNRPSVLLELDSVEFAPRTGPAGKAERIAMCTPWVNALLAEIALIAKRKGATT